MSVKIEKVIGIFNEVCNSMNDLEVRNCELSIEGGEVAIDIYLNELQYIGKYSGIFSGVGEHVRYNENQIYEGKEDEIVENVIGTGDLELEGRLRVYRGISFYGKNMEEDSYSLCSCEGESNIGYLDIDILGTDWLGDIRIEDIEGMGYLEDDKGIEEGKVNIKQVNTDKVILFSSIKPTEEGVNPTVDLLESMGYVNMVRNLI